MSVIAAITFVILSVTGFTFIDGMNGGFALAFVSLYLAVSAIAVAGLFTYHARVMDTILSGTHVHAHWTYPEGEAERSANREFREYQERNRGLFWVVGGMLGVVALVFLVFVGDGGVETAALLFLVIIIIFIVSKIAPVRELKRALKTSHEAYIADNGIIYEGTVYPFHSFLMKMTGIGFHEGNQKKPAVIVCSFTQLIGHYIIQSFEVAIPVPAGYEMRAREIVDTLSYRK